MNKTCEFQNGIVNVTEETVTGDVAIPDGKLMSKPYFRVSHDTFVNGMTGKKKRKQWKTHLGKTDESNKIRLYASKNKGQPFFLKSNQTGEYVLAHRTF